ncbi:MAG: hypothetical protein JO058_03320, partial [Alphaproteobacteria bacterium]|nr:hypothetical protein [Alphaproteobacteria bacterium]
MDGIKAEDSRFGAAETYYEHLVFMIYFPDDFREALQRNAPPGRELRPEDALDLLAWGTVFVYQARMQPFRFRAVQSRYQAPDGRFRKPHDRPGTPRSNPMFKLQLTMQLALETVMRRANLESLFDEYPTRAQLLVDTLYYVAELHSEEKTREYEFQITPEILKAYLRLRAANDRGRGLDENFPGQHELNRLFQQLGQYLHLLEKPELISEETLAYIRQWPASPNKRLWLRLARSILPGTKPIVERLEVEEDGLTFRFHLSRSGLSADDENPDKNPLKTAPAFNKALGSWIEFLKMQFGDAAAGHEALVSTRFLDENPGWGPVEDAYLLTRHLIDEPAAAPSRPTADIPGGTDDAHALLLAALQMQDYVSMLDEWRRPIALGILNAGIATAAAAQGVEGEPARRDPATCHLMAVKALGAVCHFDPLEEPAEIASALSERLRWPRGLDDARKSHMELGSHSSFAGEPQELESYCEQLGAAAARMPNEVAVRSKPDWPSSWREFWVGWAFAEQSGTVAPIERSARAEIPGSEVLHAARHG